MNKKVIDILPPKELPTVFVEKRKEVKKFPTEKEERSWPRKPEVRPLTPTFKVSLFFSFIILILVGIFCFFTLSKANIDIWPETETLTFKTKLIVDKTANAPDFVNKIIPGEIFEREKTIKENFPSSGKALKESKAEGQIRVYNAYSTSAQVLIASTRFVSTDGKIFRTPIKVTIPGGNYDKGKLIPGEIDIKVTADQPGPQYNISPSTFSIPGFAGTDKYTKFYAKSFQTMAGGFSEEVSKVTQEDLTSAENTLTKRVKEECQAFLKSELETEKISSEFNFLEKAIQTEIVETFSLSRAGDETENFDFQAKAKSKTLIFKKEDLKNFAKEFVLSQIPKDSELPGIPKLYEKSLKIDFTPETVNLNSDKIILSLDISAKIYSDIDEANYKNYLKGKSLMETKIFLEDQSEITKAKVELWPFWVKLIPENSDKIKFNLNID